MPNELFNISLHIKFKTYKNKLNMELMLTLTQTHLTVIVNNNL